MPVVDVDPDELRRLTGHEDVSDDELRADLFNLGLEYEGETEDGEFQLEFAPDRLDRLSVEGVARSLRYQYGDDRGVYIPSTTDPDWTIEVEGTPPERPYVTGAVVRGLDMGAEALDSLIQLQEKLHATMGRTRAKGAIGVHDLTMLKGAAATGEDGHGKSIRYTSVDPDEATFVPLEGDREMTPAEVVEEHHIGQEYADLVEDMDRVPAIYDSIGLFSFPPVINGRRTEVTENSRDLLVEMTGTDQWTIDHMLTIVCYALEARGGTVEEVTVEYADDAPGERAGDRLVRPDLSSKTKRVSLERVATILGLDLGPDEFVDCAERAGLDATRVDDSTADDSAVNDPVADDLGEENPTADDPAAGGPGATDSGTDGGGDAERDGAGRDGTGRDGAEGVVFDVEIPPYRVDVLHPIDVIDDVGRAYGFDALEPKYPDVSTVGGRHERSRLEDAARDALVGLGFEDLLNFYMTSEAANFDRLDVAPDDDVVGAGEPVTIQEPYSEDYTILRTWALPSLLMVLENNTHRAYPQELAEIGLAARVDEAENTNVSEWRTVAGVLARHDVSYEDAKARLQALARNFGVDLETPPTTHPSFIDGRVADVVMDGETVGVVGEVHPAVVVEHDLEVPAAAFEFRLDALR